MGAPRACFSDDGTPEFSGVGVWTPFKDPKQELESQESTPFKESTPISFTQYNELNNWGDTTKY